MNFWLLAFAIGYPPKIKHPSSESKHRELLQKDIVGLLSQNGKHFFTQTTAFIPRASRVFGGLCMAEGARRTWMRANIDRSV
jgi:hypothetical protein